MSRTQVAAPGQSPGAPRARGWTALCVALATLGEGYHNFHHRFQTDYRNGIRWFHYDPTKWLIWSLSKVGLTHGLVTLPQKVIDDAKAAAAAS